MTTTQETMTPNGFAPEAFAGLFNEAADHSRAYVERSLRLLQNETLELMNRRIDNTGAAINDYRNCKDFADLMTAQHKWFADFSRDYFDAWRRLGEATHQLMANTAVEMDDVAEHLEATAEHTLDHEAGDHETVEHKAVEMDEAMREAGREIERAARDAAE